MKRIISVLLFIVLVVNSTIPAMAVRRSIGSSAFFSYMTQSEGGQSSTNLQNFYNSFNMIDENPFYVYNDISAEPIYSYLVENETSGYSRIEAIGEKVYVEEYSKNFEYISAKEIEMELPKFGGCYVGENYCFLVFGQNNPDESDEVEVVRVVKYDKEWNRLDARSIYGANTQYPFSSGSLRMTEVNGSLYIHTCHTMYKISDGLNHQANMTFVLDEETMEVTQDYYIIMNVSEGYVSHSFNQFVVSDGTYLYRLDHGDGAPRAVVATKCKLSAIDTCRYKFVVDIPVGESGQNATGVSPGGFEIAGDLLVSTGNSVEFDGTEETMFYGVRNIYVTSTDTGFAATQKNWITNYTEDSAIEVGTPKLVKASEDTFYVLWEEADTANELLFFRIAKVSATGELLEMSEPIYGRLSDCDPVYTEDGRLVWYTTFQNTPVFYNIDTTKLDSYKYSSIDFTKCQVTLEQEECVYTDVGIDCNKMPLEVTYKGYVLKEDRDYTVTYSEMDLVGKVLVSVEGKGYFSGKIEKSYIVKPAKTAYFGVGSPTDTSIHLYWEKVPYATGYQVEQRKDGEWTLIQTLSDTEFEVTGLETFTKYEFRVRPYTEADETVYYGEYYEGETITMLETPSLEVKEKQPTSVTFTWNPIKGAARYKISWFVTTGNTTVPVYEETTELSCTVTGLEQGRTYLFSIIAYGEEDDIRSTENSRISVELPYLLSTDNTKIELYSDKYTYVPSKKIEPLVKVICGYSTLKEGTNYQVSYYDNTEIGKGKIVVTGINRYTGTLEGEFRIVPGKTEILSATSTTDTAKLSWNPVAGATGYDVYVYIGEVWSKVGTTSETECILAGLQSDTIYKYKLVAYAQKDGEIYEGNFSDEKWVQTKWTSDTSSKDETSPSIPKVEPVVTMIPGQETTPAPTAEVTPLTTPAPTAKVTPVITVTPEEQVTPTPIGEEENKVGVTPNVKEELLTRGVKLSKTTYTYNGKVQNPTVTVKNQKGEKLEEGKDYTITYSKGRKEAGIYTITIKGISDYSGIIKKTFKIRPKTTKITKVNRDSKGMTVKWKKGTGKIKGYEIQYSTYSNFKKSTKIVVGKKTTTSKKIKNLKKNKKYYIRVRTYQNVKVDGKKITLYSVWSNKKSIKR